MWLAVRDSRTPFLAKLVGALIVGYALAPIDLVPDFIPVLGLIDDAVLIPLGIWLFGKMVAPAQFAEHRAAAEAASRRPVSVWGIAIVVALWALLAWIGYTVAVLIFA